MPEIDVKGATYLGDGLYVTYDGYQLVLFAHNGLHATNVVYLEPAVWHELQLYVQRLKSGGQNAENDGV